MKKQQSTSQDTSVSTQSDPGQTAATAGSATAASATSNQDLLDRLGIPSLDDLAETGSGWLDDGLDAMGAGMLELAADNADADAGGSFVHLAWWAKEAWDEKQAREAEVQRLVEDEGLTLKDARAWVEAFGEAAFGEDEVWRFLIGPLKKFRDRIDHFGKFIAAVDALSTPDAHTRPADSLREFATLYELVTAVVPSPPVFSEFLCVYGKVLKNAANVLDEIAARYRHRDKNIPGVFRAGAFTGGGELQKFLRGIATGRIAPPSEAVTQWLIENAKLLELATGSSLPLPIDHWFGQQVIDMDKLVPSELLQWCIDHSWEIAKYALGEEEAACLMKEEGDVCF